MLRYHADAFGGLGRRTFVRALQAEGVPANLGVHDAEPLYRQPAFSREQLSARIPEASTLSNYQTMRLPGAKAIAPQNVTITHQTLLADPAGMRAIARAIQTIQNHAHEL